MDVCKVYYHNGVPRRPPSSCSTTSSEQSSTPELESEDEQGSVYEDDDEDWIPSDGEDARLAIQLQLRYASHIALPGIPKLEALTFEILANIMLHLSWYEILRLRKTCRRLSKATRRRRVWEQVFDSTLQHLMPYKCVQHIRYVYDRNVNLEYFVLQKIRVELGWRSFKTPIIRGISDDRQENKDFWGNSFIHLLQGGRWMLWSPPARDRLMVYDLEEWALSPRVLIGPQSADDEVPPVRRFSQVAVQVDPESTTGLQFQIAFQYRANSSSQDMSEGNSNTSTWVVEVWKINQLSTCLNSNRLSRLETSQPRHYVPHAGISLCGNNLTRVWRMTNAYNHPVALVETLETRCHPNSNHPTLFTSFFLKLPVYFPSAIHLLPGGRVLCANNYGLYIFNNADFWPTNGACRPAAVPLDSFISDAVPIARYTFPSSPSGTPQPRCDEYDTKIALLFDDGIYGLEIPHGPTPLPVDLQAIQLCRFLPPMNLRAVGCARVGINKAYIWPEGEFGFAVTYVWPERDGQRRDARYMQRVLGWRDDSLLPAMNSTIRSTNVGWGPKHERMMLAPHLDEVSGKVLTHVRGKGWGLIEFA